MKFVCMRCEQRMLLDTATPAGDSLRMLFDCSGCGARFAMITNAGETQLVTSLGVSLATAADPPPAVSSPRSEPRQQDEADVEWSAAARERLGRVPEFVRPMARQAIERFAQQQGQREITTELMDLVKKDAMPGG